ncbi:MAG: hypothetical protein RBU23_13295 [Candidatus Auribacterota bacterium]|jgi:hypothetical protein|nr:hypothetical protein [Candidatus Auribacterota bacterium]
MKAKTMKEIINQHLHNLNETSYIIIRDYNPLIVCKSKWTVDFYNGGSFTYTYDNKLMWNGIVE